MSGPSLVIVVAEDRHQSRLIWRYLKKCGVGTHAIRIHQAPAGAGSAEAWVRDQFPTEVKIYRNRPPQTALIVAIDADIRTVQHRLNQLDEALRGAAQPAIQTEEQIARLVPKRNVETWILCLNDHNVNEEEDYKSRQVEWGELIPFAANQLHEWTRETPLHCTDSLRTAIAGLARLRF